MHLFLLINQLDITIIYIYIIILSLFKYINNVYLIKHINIENNFLLIKFHFLFIILINDLLLLLINFLNIINLFKI